MAGPIAVANRRIADRGTLMVNEERRRDVLGTLLDAIRTAGIRSRTVSTPSRRPLRRSPVARTVA
jgi:hypothetical protein